MPCSGRGSWVIIKTNGTEGEIILSKKGQNSNNKNVSSSKVMVNLA
jgi:hypothetical protein